MLTGTVIVLAGLAACAAGLVNALAGGGALISLGVPAVMANVTNTVALCPGYLGGAVAQKNDLRGQGKRLRMLVPAAVIGGIIGGILLLWISSEVFQVLVPFLILFTSGLLAIQDRVRDWIGRHTTGAGTADRKGAVVPIGLAAVYGGYFGPGLSVIVLAVLGLTMDDTLPRLNAVKQCISLSANVAAAVLFLFSGMVVWPLALVMGAGALAGGMLGGKIAGRINPDLLRWTIVVIGAVIGIVFLLRL